MNKDYSAWNKLLSNKTDFNDPLKIANSKLATIELILMDFYDGKIQDLAEEISLVLNSDEE